MKATAKFSIFPAQVGQDVFDALCSLHPEARGKFGFNCEIEEGTAALARILGFLKQHGFTPWHKFGKKLVTQFDYRVERTFSREELATAELLVPKPKVYVEGTGATSRSGPLQAQRSSLRKRVLDVGFVDLWQRLIVSAGFRQLAFDAGLVGMEFGPIELVGSKKNPEVTTQFFELRSQRKMPSLSGQCSLVDADGRPFNGDYANGCFLSEGCYEEPLLCYERRTVAQVCEIDFLWTVERFGNYSDIALPYPVVTQRVYSFCQTHDFTLEWLPVRIHD